MLVWKYSTTFRLAAKKMPAHNFEPDKHKFNCALIVLGIIFLSVAASATWWTEGHGSTASFSLWEMVQCTSSVCTVSTANTAGWINFVRLMVIMGLFCLGSGLISVILYIFILKPIFRQAVLLFTGIAGGVLSITGFVTAVFFRNIGNQYNTLEKRNRLDPTALRFQTLPLGFIFLSAFISCLVAVFTLVNIEPKKRRKFQSVKLGDYQMAPVKQSNDHVEVLAVTKLKA